MVEVVAERSTLALANLISNQDSVDGHKSIGY